MRVLLSTIGSEGDVRPVIALALAIRELGHDAHLCVPPDFRQRVEGLGLSMTAIGPEVRSTGRADPAAPPPTAAQRRELARASLMGQFETIGAAASGCDAIVGATALQIAAPTIAEQTGIPYIFAAYCPAVLPSLHHAPPVYATPADATVNASYAALWDANLARFNETFGDALNAERTARGLARVDDVARYVFTQRPWIAADPKLAPWPVAGDPAVFQTGAWVLRDETPLPAELEAFLEAGDPPVYFGFGSVRAPRDLGATMIAAARAVGRRAIVLRGWAELELVNGGPDCLAVGMVNHRILFRRVAAVVHHGGAGTTTASALAGAPQVVIPQIYDQHYWARQVDRHGIGSAHAAGAPTTESLTAALRHALTPATAERARDFAAEMVADGAAIAARSIVSGSDARRRAR